MPKKLLLQKGDQRIKLHFKWSSLRRETRGQVAQKEDRPARHCGPFSKSFVFLPCEFAASQNFQNSSVAFEFLYDFQS